MLVRTILGDVPAETLGHTQCHEHIWLRKGPSFDCNPALCMEDYDRSLRELLDYRTAGGGAIVDAQPGGFGRDAGQLERLSRESGVQIVAVTGFHKPAFLEDPVLRQLTAAALESRFVSELVDGMLLPDGSRSTAKAGMVKATWDGQGLKDPLLGPWFAAVAAAAAQTGAPVLIHTEPTTDVPALVQFFARFGVPAQRLLLCHLDRSQPNPNLHRQVLSMGCSLCYDSVHRLKYVSHEQELALIAAMCREGYADQIVLSLDTTAGRLRHYGAPDMGLDYLLRDYLPMLRQAGLSDKIIEKLFRTNAARMLAVFR